MWAAILGGLGRLAEALAKIGPLVAAYLAGRERTRRQQAEEAIDDAETARKVRRDIAAADDDRVVELRRKWTRTE